MSDRPTTLAEPEFLFGPFRLLPAQQILLEGRAPVRIGSRALEILTALVEHAGQLVGRGELIARAWPNTFVEEANLNVHIAALRRALGEGQPGNRYVATVPGRGYRFVAPVNLSESRVQPVLRANAAMRAHNLPAASTRLIGRADAVDALLRQLPKHRFVTVVGPGGIGKTRSQRKWPIGPRPWPSPRICSAPSASFQHNSFCWREGHLCVSAAAR